MNGANWVQEMNRTNLFFHHMGVLRMEEGNLKIIKSINISLIEEQITRVQKEVWNFADSCVNSLCTGNKERGSFYISQTKRLEHELGSVYALLGRYRTKRSLDFLGSGLKYMTGTMDHDDEVYIASVLQNLGDRQDKLHSSMNSTVYLMTNMTKQWELLKDNQRTQLNNFLTLKKTLLNYYNETEQKEWEFDFKTFESHLDNLILSVQVQIEKLKNAVLFLKAGVVDPYFVDTEELIQSLTYKRIRYHVTPKDVDIILGNTRPIALFDSKTLLIHIVFQIPVAREGLFNLYENLIVPKNFAGEVVVLDNIPKYFVVAYDNTKFYTLDTLNCLIIFENYICKGSVLMNVGYQRDCITDLFFLNNDNNCIYHQLKRKVEAHNIINTGIIVFSADTLSVQLTCPNHTELQNLTGAHILQAPPQCSINSTSFEYDRLESEEETHLVNRMPIIMCCSPFYRMKNHSNHEFNGSIILRSLHDIRTIDYSNYSKELTNWEKFQTINFKDHVEPWHINLTLVVIAIIIFLIIWNRVKNICGSPQPATVIKFSALKQRERDDGNPF